MRFAAECMVVAALGFMAFGDLICPRLFRWLRWYYSDSSGERRKRIDAVVDEMLRRHGQGER